MRKVPTFYSSVTAFLCFSLVTEDQQKPSPLPKYSDEDILRRCIHDIQDTIIDRLADILKVLFTG